MFQVCFEVCLLVIEGLYSSLQVYMIYTGTSMFPKNFPNIFLVRNNINPRSRVKHTCKHTCKFIRYIIGVLYFISVVISLTEGNNKKNINWTYFFGKSTNVLRSASPS
jgi:hypothetical protein